MLPPIKYSIFIVVKGCLEDNLQPSENYGHDFELNQ